MACQIILVVESDEQSRSDFIYINSILNENYKIRLNNDIKVSPVFLGGKGNYCQSKIIKKINKLVKTYSLVGSSHVVYCFDTDKYESEPEHKKMLLEEETFCSNNNFDFVWFCHDIEEVFWGKSVAKNEKTSKAKAYLTQNRVKGLDLSIFRMSSYSKRKSNLLLVLDQYLNAENHKI